MLVNVVPRIVIIITKFLDSKGGGSITPFFWLFVKLYCRGKNNPCQRDNNAKFQIKQFNNGRSISHTDSVRLCDYRLTHIDTKEHTETPGTWAEPLEHSDPLPLGAATGQWPAHCQCETHQVSQQQNIPRLPCRLKGNAAYRPWGWVWDAETQEEVITGFLGEETEVTKRGIKSSWKEKGWKMK